LPSKLHRTSELTFSPDTVAFVSCTGSAKSSSSTRAVMFDLLLPTKRSQRGSPHLIPVGWVIGFVGILATCSVTAEQSEDGSRMRRTHTGMGSSHTQCDASSLQTNAASLGTCSSSIDPDSSGCTQNPNCGYTCALTTCTGGSPSQTTYGACTPNPTCDAHVRRGNAVDVGTCSSTLAAGTNCLNTAEPGFTCTNPTASCSCAGAMSAYGECTATSLFRLKPVWLEV